MTRLNANLLLLLTGAIWGMGFVSQSVAMERVGPLLFVGLRFAIAFLTILPLSLRERRDAERPLSARDWSGFLVVGLTLFGGAATQQIGITTTTVTHSGFLTGLYVVMVPFLGLIIFRQLPHAVVWPAAGCALAGIYLLSGGSMSELGRGDWLTILCAVFWALQILFVARFTGARPMALSTVQFAVCAVLSLAGAALAEPVEASSIVATGPELLFAGIFSSGIAFTLQIVGQRHTTAPQAAIFLSSEALFAAFFGALFLGEQMTLASYTGCLLIFASMIAVEVVPMLTESRRRLREAER